MRAAKRISVAENQFSLLITRAFGDLKMLRLEAIRGHSGLTRLFAFCKQRYEADFRPAAFIGLVRLIVLGSSVACAAWPTSEANMRQVCLVEFSCLWLFSLLPSDSRTRNTASMRLAYDSCLGYLAGLLSRERADQCLERR